MSIDEPITELQSLPKSIKWGGLTLPLEYEGETTSYSTSIERKGLTYGISLRYNQSTFRSDTEHNRPFEAAIEVSRGRESEFNPAPFSLRVTDKGHEQIGGMGPETIEIALQAGDGKRGATYEFEAIECRQVYVTTEEWEWPSKENHWQSLAVEKPTMFAVVDDAGREKVDITDPKLIMALDQLGLPTVFWGGDESKTDFMKKPATIKPFPELLKGMERVVRTVTTNTGMKLLSGGDG